MILSIDDVDGSTVQASALTVHGRIDMLGEVRIEGRRLRIDRFHIQGL